ncbi:MAG TPA: GGDEF domain-containing protein [Blastocatellia bacterium]|nr:GGDEF domain-containing protein [Blastocatellia bacterium]
MATITDGVAPTGPAAPRLVDSEEMGLPAKRAILGIVLAQGAPAGWLVVQWLRSGVSPAEAISDEPGLYLYLVTATSAIFAVFGFVMGRFEDRLQRANEALDHLSRTDALTGLDNVRNLSEVLPKLVSYAHRTESPLSVVAIDIDRFKLINDRYGHLAGDAVLKQFGRVLADGRRTEDVVARIGGEEFVVVLPGVDREGAERAGVRVLEAVRAMDVDVQGVSVRITISAGIAQLNPGDDLRTLLSRADAALYRAKQEGRNRLNSSSLVLPTTSDG